VIHLLWKDRVPGCLGVVQPAAGRGPEGDDGDAVGSYRPPISKYGEMLKAVTGLFFFSNYFPS
jgi:hypothetical protein